MQILKAQPYFTPTSRIINIILKELPKALIYQWSDNESLPLPARKAIAVLFDHAKNQALSVHLNLTSKDVTKVIPAPEGSQPTLSYDEQVEGELAVRNSEEFKEALERHYGITDTSLVMVDIWSVGYYGAEEEKASRLIRPLCFLRNDPTDNGYARPLEGIRPIVDLNLMKVRWALGDVAFLFLA